MGTNLTIDLARFELTYTMHDGDKSPIYRLFPSKQGTNYPNPFNTPETAFLFPTDVATFGYNVYVTSAVSVPQEIWWSVKIEFFRQDNSAVPKNGVHGTQDLSWEGLVGNPSGATVKQGDHVGAGFTPVIAPPLTWSDTAWQTKDFGTDPVRMRVTCTARNAWDVTPGSAIPEPNPAPIPAPNMVEVWIRCV